MELNKSTDLRTPTRVKQHLCQNNLQKSPHMKFMFRCVVRFPVLVKARHEFTFILKLQIVTFQRSRTRKIRK